MDGLPLPRLIPLGHDRWQVAEDFTYDGITVPKNFRTDGASSPLHIIITRWGGHYAAAVLIHDWLYDCLNNRRPYPGYALRKACDDELYKVMMDYGVAPLVASAIYFAVRWFGGNSFIKGLVVAE